METFIKNAILFMHQYRDMEDASHAFNGAFIKNIASDDWTANHLYETWTKCVGNFGRFFLSLDHHTQANFIEAWGIVVEGKLEYQALLQTNPKAVLTTKPPETVAWLHELVKYFYNNNIGEDSELFFTRLPVQEKRYGTSRNWGKFILSLPKGEQQQVLHSCSIR